MKNKKNLLIVVLVLVIVALVAALSLSNLPSFSLSNLTNYGDNNDQTISYPASYVAQVANDISVSDTSSVLKSGGNCGSERLRLDGGCVKYNFTWDVVEDSVNLGWEAVQHLNEDENGNLYYNIVEYKPGKGTNVYFQKLDNTADFTDNTLFTNANEPFAFTSITESTSDVNSYSKVWNDTYFVVVEDDDVYRFYKKPLSSGSFTEFHSENQITTVSPVSSSINDELAALLTMDDSGNLYYRYYDSSFKTYIKKVTPNGTVTTLVERSNPSSQIEAERPVIIGNYLYYIVANYNVEEVSTYYRKTRTSSTMYRVSVNGGQAEELGDIDKAYRIYGTSNGMIVLGHNDDSATGNYVHYRYYNPNPWNLVKQYTDSKMYTDSNTRTDGSVEGPKGSLISKKLMYGESTFQPYVITADGYRYKLPIPDSEAKSFMAVKSTSSSFAYSFISSIVTSSDGDIYMIVSAYDQSASTPDDTIFLHWDLDYSDVTDGPTTNEEPSSVVMHRYYNASKGVHFYTDNTAAMQRFPDYTYEKEAFKVFPKSNAASYEGDTNIVPVYRFYNPETGAHFYTANATQAERVKSNFSPPFIYEGIKFYVYSSESGLGTELRKFFNPSTGAHFFTAFEGEMNTLTNDSRFNTIFMNEGEAFRVVSL